VVSGTTRRASSLNLFRKTLKALRNRDTNKSISHSVSPKEHAAVKYGVPKDEDDDPQPTKSNPSIFVVPAEFTIRVPETPANIE
jgi:hypothetical protein